MDGQMVGLVGGIAGGILGTLGGLVGTYFSIKNTNGSRERAYMIRAAIFCWIGVSAFLACLFLMPMRWSWLLWLVYMPSLFWLLRRGNEGQARARFEDMGKTESPAS